MGSSPVVVTVIANVTNYRKTYRHFFTRAAEDMNVSNIITQSIVINIASLKELFCNCPARCFVISRCWNILVSIQSSFGLVWLTSNTYLVRAIFGINHPLVIFENFEIALVSLGEFQNFQKSTRVIYSKSPCQACD